MILKAADVEKNPERMARTGSEPTMEKECGKQRWRGRRDQGLGSGLPRHEGRRGAPADDPGR